MGHLNDFHIIINVKVSTSSHNNTKFIAEERKLSALLGSITVNSLSSNSHSEFARDEFTNTLGSTFMKQNSLFLTYTQNKIWETATVSPHADTTTHTHSNTNLSTNDNSTPGKLNCPLSRSPCNHEKSDTHQQISCLL